jgi:hypothetical protein
VGISVTGLSVAPVKSMRLQAVEQIRLERTGVRDNRRFYVIDHRDHLVNGKRLGELQALTADYEHDTRRLRVVFPDGKVLDETVQPGALIKTWFYGEPALARVLDGPWSDALMEYTGHALKLVEAQAPAVDRGPAGVASLISRSSLERLAEEVGEDDIDCRRFRMLIEIDGVEAHAEDRWVGREVRLGEAKVEFGGHVGRCVITTRDPDTGAVDLPTLKMLGSYRLDLDTTEPLAFGIHGRVIEPGTVRVGDLVTPGDSVPGR